MKKVYFVIASLRAGGAERACVEIISAMDSRRFNLHIVLFEREGVYIEHLPKTVVIHSIDHSPRIIWHGLEWLFLLFKLGKFCRTEKPDVIVSFTWYVNFVVLLLRMLRLIQSNVIVVEQSTLSFTEGKVAKYLRKCIVRFIYPFADKIVAVSRTMSEQFNRQYNIPVKKLSVIYNPVDIEKIRHATHEAVAHSWFHSSVPVVIAVGRLHPAKGFPYLIRAFSILTKEFEARLIILGEGEERESLQQLINDLGLNNHAELAGFKKNPYKYLAKTTIYVLSSIYEGLPIALVEAMAAGAPCIATRCPTGPEEIITHEVNGLLVPPADGNAMAEAIKILLKDPGFRKELSESGKKRVEDFRVEKIVKQYEDLIMDVMK